MADRGCTTVPYEFSRDYCANFFNFAKSTQPEQVAVERDFIRNLSRLLERLHCSSAYSIARSLFSRMCDPQLVYHTPVHILSIFQFATENQIPLAWWEEVALWFHDAVYVPAYREPGGNEWASAKFMEAMLGPFIANQKLTLIAMAIHWTARHEEPNVPSKFGLILDLDLCNFLFDNPGKAIAAYCVKQEFEPLVTAKQWCEARVDFFSKLAMRSSVFRSKTFQCAEQAGKDYVLQNMDAHWDDLRVMNGIRPIGP